MSRLRVLLNEYYLSISDSPSYLNEKLADPGKTTYPEDLDRLCYVDNYTTIAKALRVKPEDVATFIEMYRRLECSSFLDIRKANKKKIEKVFGEDIFKE